MAMSVQKNKSLMSLDMGVCKCVFIVWPSVYKNIIVFMSLVVCVCFLCVNMYVCVRLFGCNFP